MSAIPQPASSRFVSERILDPLRQVARRQWTVLATKGVIQTLLLSLGLILAAVLILGRFDNVPVWVRVPVALIVWGSVIGSAIYFLRPALQRRSLVRTALDVEEKLKLTHDTHERISSSVELSAEKDARFAGSPALIRHLVAQAEADAAAVDPRKVVPADKVVRLGMLLLPLLLLWIGMVWWLPRERMLLPMFHLLMPWKSAPAVLSHVGVEPGDKTLAQGDNLEILVHVNTYRAADNNRRINHATLTLTDASGQPTVQEMTRTGARDFRIAMDNLQKGFRYRVHADEVDSDNYTITVNPRPSVEQLDLRYEYPHYTGLEPRVETNNQEGAIDALQGTKVTITVHCSNELAAESRVVVTDRVTGVKPEPRDVPLQKTAEGIYQAQMVLTNSAEYAIKLTNKLGLSNKDDQPHPITVRYDEKPTIAITWPQSSITARPDDTVPVAFLATDDFGVSKVEAFVQVDGAPEPKPVAVKVAAGDSHSISDKYALDVAKALADAKLPDAQGLTYWLKATDNRDPDPQSVDSTRQTLRLSKGAEGIERQRDEKRAKDLTEAIRKAIGEVEQERPLAEQFSWIEPNRTLTTDEKQNAENLKDKIEKTSSDLVGAAAEHKEDAFADIAAKAKAIAEQPILAAADDVSKVELHTDSGEARKKDAHDAGKSLVDARTQLEALLKKAEQQAKNVETADQLKELAKDQKKLADQAAKAQPNQPQDQSAQQQVAQQTQQAVAQDQPLQNNEKAKHEALKLAQLLNKVEEIQKQQQAQEQQVQKQAEAAEVQQKANDLARKQEELNKKIEQFKHDDKSALEKAGAQPPQEQQQKNIVKELDQNQVQQAANEQKQAAQQLENAANQLQQKANDNNLQPNADQQAAINQQQQQAQQAQQEVQQAQQEGQQAQQAQQATQQAAQQAEQAQKADNADQKKNAAQQAAQAAQQAGQVAKQIEQQAKAIEKQAEAAAQDGHADVQQAAHAAQEAAQQAEKSAQAAQQAAQAAQADAQNGDAPKAAQDAAEAGKDAAQAAQQEQNAAQQLAQADGKEAEHAKAEMTQQQKDEAAQAAGEAKDLAKEQAALAQAAQADAQALQQAQQGAQTPQQAAAEEKQLAHETRQAANLAQQLEQVSKEVGNPELAKRAEAAQKDLKEAQAAQEQAAAAETAGQPEQAAGQQEKAENHLAQAEQALRGLQQADAGKPDAGQEAGKPDAGQAQADAGKPDAGQGQEAGKPESGQGQAQAAEPHPGEAGQAQASAAQQAATPQQAMQHAAEHAQEAIQAQQQAAQGQAQASQEAAQALAQAAQELAQATSPTGEPGQDQGQGQEPGQDPGKGPQKQPTPVAGQATDPTMGLQAQANAANDARPPSVQELGISASDWAKLGPLQQRELINAAQQSGPPGYQSMIKNYYVRLAHMQAQGSGQR